MGINGISTSVTKFTVEDLYEWILNLFYFSMTMMGFLNILVVDL